MSNELPGTAEGAGPWAILWVCVKQQTDAAGGVIAIRRDLGERRQQGGRDGKCGKAVETRRSNISLVGIAEGDDGMSRGDSLAQFTGKNIPVEENTNPELDK